MYYIDKNFESWLSIPEVVIAAIFKRHSKDYNKIKNRFGGMTYFYGVNYTSLLEFLDSEGIQYKLFDGYAETIDLNG